MWFWQLQVEPSAVNNFTQLTAASSSEEKKRDTFTIANEGKKKTDAALFVLNALTKHTKHERINNIYNSH